LIATVEEWAAARVNRLAGIDAVVVVGSVVRGDFNQWSDTDVLVVAQQLPAERRQRDLAIGSTPPGVQVIAWTHAELDVQSQRGDPIAVEAVGDVVVMWRVLPAR
jgi:hypothetical protein